MTNHFDIGLRLRELRDMARDVTIQEAAKCVSVSYTHMWNAEHGYARLTDEQIELLEALYIPKINERLTRLSLSLGAHR